MSCTETHVGKLRKVDLQGVELEDWCKTKCEELGINRLSSYNDSWHEEFINVRDNNRKFFHVNGELWEAFEHISQDDGYDIDIMIPNEDGTITFVMQFYNGGTCLTEVIEEGLENLKNKK